MPANPSQYLVPALDAKADHKLDWLKETFRDGETFLKNQRSWKDIDLGVAIISGEAAPKTLKGMSDINVPMVKRDVREAVATLANMRPLWGYKTYNEQYEHQAKVLNKMLRAWYYYPFVRASIRGALQYATGCGMGWVCPFWDDQRYTSGKGEIILENYGPRDIVPYAMGKDNEIQKAYLVTIRKETPLQLAMIQYPTMLDYIVPSRGMPSWMKKGTGKVQRFLSPLLNALGQGAGRETSDTNPFPTVDIFHSYILDQSINTTGKTMEMGQAGWAYEVPSLDSDIPTGIYDSQNRPLLRKANEEDAKIFPLRRRIIWTEQGILDDGSSPYWHGKFPGVPFVTDNWPWDFLGYPMARDGASIERSATRLLRGLDDSANVKIDPPMAYDENAISSGLMDRFNPRKPGQRIKINSQANEKPITLPVPSEFYQVDSWVAGMPAQLYEVMHYILGTRDIQALAKAKQVPSGDSIEKLMELAGPILSDMSSNMEGSMMELGEMWKGLAFEFYNMRRRVQVLGKDGVTEEEFDFDPANMIPSHLPDEFEKIKQNELLAEQGGIKYQAPPSRASLVQRAKTHLQSFYFHITPSSLHQITQLTRKMLMLQLWKGGFPVDPWTVAASMDIDNYGVPDGLKKILHLDNVPEDVMGKWIMWKELLSKFGPQPGMPGRKGSGQTPPAHQSKDGGTRTTVRESPR